MKKYLPIGFFVLGLLVLTGVYFFVIKGDKKEGVVEEEEIVTEIAFDKRPVVSLTPIKDGHWLKLQIMGIKVEAASLEYELLYKTKDGSTQGVPGSVKLDDGKKDFERELLMGSESSGKFRYDEGVSEGTLTLRFRNERGKLIGKLSTEFHLQTNAKQLTSQDGKFSFTLNSAPKGAFFVTMGTFGIPGVTATPQSGPYGIFSQESDLAGSPEGTWTKVEYTKASSLGIYYK